MSNTKIKFVGGSMDGQIHEFGGDARPVGHVIEACWQLPLSDEDAPYKDAHGRPVHRWKHEEYTLSPDGQFVLTGEREASAGV